MRTNFMLIPKLASITITAVASLVVPLWLLGVRPPSPSPGGAHAARDSTLTIVRAPAPPPVRLRAVQPPETFVPSGERTAFLAGVHTHPQARPHRRPTPAHVASAVVHHVLRTTPHTSVVTAVRKPRPSIPPPRTTTTTTTTATTTTTTAPAPTTTAPVTVAVAVAVKKTNATNDKSTNATTASTKRASPHETHAHEAHAHETHAHETHAHEAHDHPNGADAPAERRLRR